MPKVLSTKSLDWNDVCLVAEKPSVIDHRDRVSLDTSRIIVAPMASIRKINYNAILNGFSVCVDRLMDLEHQYDHTKHLLVTRDVQSYELGIKPKIWLSVGLKDWNERSDLFNYEIKNESLGILLDVANGFSVEVGKTLMDIIKKYPNLNKSINLMTGNVNSKEGFNFLDEFGSRMIRCSIGSGLVCETSKRTGYGRGAFTLISELYNFGRDSGIIMDGGLKTPGDVAKAFMAGADHCMMGGYFKDAIEAECDVYFGGASTHAKKIQGMDSRYIEGTSIEPDSASKRTYNDLANDLKEGLRSAVSYSGYSSLDLAIGKGTFEVYGQATP